jgi:hypothetical protein
MTRTTIALALAGVALSTVALAPSAASAAVPAFAFDECPALPAGADPAKWRCEEMHATGSVRLGKVTLPVTLKATHAEGRLAGDTQTRFIFGTLRSAPVPVPGGLLGRGYPIIPAKAALEYAGHIDFLAGPPMAEILHLRYRVDSPLTRKGCTVGTDEDPLVIVGTIVGDRVPDPDDPRVLTFRVEDDEFAVPAARGCGPFGALVGHRFGLPATGTLGLDVAFSVRTYDQVTPATSRPGSTGS